MSFANLYEFQITLPPLISNAGQMRVPLFTIFANYTAVIVRILTKEALWIIITVNVDFGQSIVSCRFFTAFMNP